MRASALLVTCMIVGSCGRTEVSGAAQKSAPRPVTGAGDRASAPQDAEAIPEERLALPEHKFKSSSRPGRSRSQVRAIVQLGTLTEAEFRQTAVELCRKHQSKAAGSFLVQFFSDSSSLVGWDGTGLLRDSDWPHWLCRVAVDTSSGGRLSARTFKLAIDEDTGRDRTDVLRE